MSRSALALTLFLILGGCGSNNDSVPSGQLGDALFAAEIGLFESQEAYLGIEAPEDLGSATGISSLSRETWLSWLEGAESRLQVLRQGFQQYSDVASQVLDRIDPGQFEASTGYSMGLLREFRDAYATWLSAQEQQFELSSDCLSRLPSADEVAGCYTNGFEIHAADWNAAAARINTVIALIR